MVNQLYRVAWWRLFRVFFPTVPRWLLLHCFFSKSKSLLENDSYEYGSKLLTHTCWDTTWQLVAPFFSGTHSCHCLLHLAWSPTYTSCCSARLVDPLLCGMLTSAWLARTLPAINERKCHVIGQVRCPLLVLFHWCPLQMSNMKCWYSIEYVCPIGEYRPNISKYDHMVQLDDFSWESSLNVQFHQSAGDSLANDRRLASVPCWRLYWTRRGFSRKASFFKGRTCSPIPLKLHSHMGPKMNRSNTKPGFWVRDYFINPWSPEIDEQQNTDKWCSAVKHRHAWECSQKFQVLENAALKQPANKVPDI